MEVVCVLIVLTCGLSGYFISQKYTKRYNFYNMLNKFCDFFISNISFSKIVLENLFLKFRELNGDSLHSETNSVLEIIKDGGAKLNIQYLTRQERDDVELFFKEIGGFEQALEIKRAESFKEYVKKKISICEEEKLKKQPLIYKLGIVVGLVFAIIII